MIRNVGRRILGLAVLMTAVMATAVHAQQPTVVLSIRGIDPLLDDAEFIGGEVGQEDVKATAEQLLGAFTNGKGLAGIDKTKPLGLYWNSTAGAPEMPVLFVPVADADDLKGLLTDLAPDFKEAKGQWTMTFNGNKLFAKVANGYCFISNAPTSLTKTADPAKIINSKYDIALDINVAGIPDELKDAFLTQMEATGRASMENGPEPKNDAEKVGREVGFNTTLAVFKSLVNDGDKLTFGIDVDEEARLAATDFSITGKANTDLSKSLSAYGKTVPAFAGLGSDKSPFRLLVSYPTTGITEQLNALFDAMRGSADEQIDKDEKLDSDADKEAAKGIAKRIFDIAQNTAKSGSMHSGIVLEDSGDGKARFIAGTKVAQGDEAGKLFDDVIKLSKDNPDIAKIKVDAAKHAGARIHEVTIEQDEENEKYFGDEPGHFAIRNDSLWMSLGVENLAALKKTLDSWAKPKTPPAGTSPISLRVKPAALVMLLQKDDEDAVERAKEVVGKPGDKLNVDLAPIPNGAKLRFEFGIDLLQLIDQSEE
jgi:hypothetical protein